jgi:exosortase
VSTPPAILPTLDGASPDQQGTARPQLPSVSVRPITWANLIVLAGAFGALFWINLARLWQWTNPSSGDPNWGHSLFIPLISLAYLLDRRDRLKQTPVRPAPGGLLVILSGIAVFVAGIGVSANFAQFGPYLQDLGMLTTLFGCVLAVFGWKMVRVALFPIAYLVCALPWPPYVHDVITQPLQKIAATASVHVLQLTGMNVEQAGNTIHIVTAAGADRALNVAEACSGMRSLITFIAVGLAVAFLSARPLWQKIVISASAVPIAIACNIFRIAGEGLLDQHVSRSLSQGFAHSAVGVVLLVPGFGLFLLVGWMLDKLTGRRRPVGTGGRISFRPAPGTAMPSLRGGAIAPRRMLIAVLCILLTSAGALAASSRLLHLYFLKVPVPLPRPLTEIPADLGPWRQCGGNRAIAADVQETLGTNDYIFRDYVDSRVVGEQEVETIRQHPSEAAADLVSTLTASHPGALVRVAVTYYTGRVDAVIHQSERCNLAGGIATSIESEPGTWDLGGRPLNVRTVHLIKDLPEGETSHYIAYCYCVNGREETEAWRVRGILMNIFAREAWYAKIEVTTGLSDARESQRVLSDFLRYALPEIEAGLPPMQKGTATAPSPGKAGKTGT